jgi:ABC-type spermidine/putrescine transport system permease subunit I
MNSSNSQGVTTGEESAIERAPRFIRPFLERDRLRYYLQLFPMIFLLVGFLFLPLAGIVALSFTPSSPFGFEISFTVENYVTLFNSHHMGRLIDTVFAGGLQIVGAFLVGFPLAYYTGIKKRNSPYTFPLLLLFAVPFFTNYILRTLAWTGILGREGVVNSALLSLGVVNEPLGWLLYSEFAVQVGMLAGFAPFLLFPAWLGMNRIDDEVLLASNDVGASQWQTIRYIVIPLAMPGIVIGAVFVFVGVLGETVIPTLLGGPAVTFIGTSIGDAANSLNLPYASAMSSVVMGLAIVIVLLWERIFGLKSVGEI